MTESEIRNCLTTKLFGKNIFAYESVDSTNTQAKSLAVEGAEEGTLVIAEEQTSGRGRLGRSWFTERGKNLTFSVILKPNISPQHTGVISLYSSLSVAEAIQRATGLLPECKWPNDVLLNRKKVCGILSDSMLKQFKMFAVVVGVGINVNQSTFPAELNATATSLSLAAGKSIDRFHVLSLILERLEYWYGKILSGELEEVIRHWTGYCTIFGKAVSVVHQGKRIEGTARGLASDGSLIVQSDGEELKLLSGDVSIKGY